MRFIIALAFLTSSAQAQADLPCLTHYMPYADMVKVLKDDYQEDPVASGLVNPREAIEIFASEIGTWTILIVKADGPACMMASGFSWTGMNPPGVRL